MIKFTGIGKDGPVFFLGLSRGNIERLTAGQPIPVDLAEMGGPPLTIVILFGETEEKLFDILKTGGLLPDAARFQMPEPGEQHVVRIKKQ